MQYLPFGNPKWEDIFSILLNPIDCKTFHSKNTKEEIKLKFK